MNMRKIIVCISLTFFVLFSYAQKEKFEVKVAYLNNGMKVMLCEDRSKSEIYGGICVHAGSKNDPAEATGMAHYLEHMMFKGTDKIGTLNWTSEKRLIDEISALYDQLSETKDEKVKKNILKELNKLSAEAAQYAIPNEVDVILSEIGSTNVNAFTSNDFTVYHNIFPSGELEKWAAIYAERFRNPVFRLFQSELEAVYEEYNMYSDDPFSVYEEDVMAAFFKGHPYAVPVIGYPEHIKNPSMSKMYNFFRTYYVPKNMTLVLVGNFKTDYAMKILNKAWGGELEFKNAKEAPVLKNAIKEVKGVPVTREEAESKGSKFSSAITKPDRVTQKVYPVPEHRGQQIITSNQTPIKIGSLCFPAVSSNNPDALLLDLCAEILSNDFSTGLCDKLMNDNKLYSFSVYNNTLSDAGVFIINYCPKMDGQSHEEAEKLIQEQIEKLKKGDFNDQLFEAVKMNYLKEAQSALENIYSKFYLVLSLDMENKTTVDFEKELDRITHLSKKELVEIARKYFNNDLLIYRSDIGSKKTNTIEKPSWKPIPAQNTDKHSDFAKKLEQYNSEPSKIQKINFEKDVTILPVNNSFDLFASKNSYNNIFTLNLVFDYGSYHNPDLENAVAYFNLQGTQEMTLEDFNMSLQTMGASLNLYTNDTRLVVSIEGFDNDFDKIMELCAEKIYKPGNDKTKLDILLEDHVNNLQVMKEDGASMGQVLFNYALYGKNSPWLKTPSTAQIKKYNENDLLDILKKAFRNEGHITYVGGQDAMSVLKSIQQHFQLYNTETQKKKPTLAKADMKETLTKNTETYVPEKKEKVRPVMNYQSSEIFVLHNPKFIQSNIYFYIPSKTIDAEGKARSALFNEYYDGGMNSIIFQNIRELHSLGYSAYAYFSYDILNRRNAYLTGFLGTQSDKTIEGIEAMSDLLKSFLLKPEKFETAKLSLLKKYEANHISFRDIPEQVYQWMLEGYENDPRSTITSMTAGFKANNIADFFNSYIGNRPLIITIAGNMNRIKKKQLSKFGKVTFLNNSDILNN